MEEKLLSVNENTDITDENQSTNEDTQSEKQETKITSTHIQEDTLPIDDVLSPENDTNASATPKTKFTKKKIVICSVMLVAIIAGTVAFAFLYKSEFQRVKDECIQIAGTISSKDDYFTIDTYPDIYEDLDDIAKEVILPDAQEGALEAIKYANEEFNFNSSLYSRMLETNALMGRQSEENDKYKVSWSYHPDDGLEVTYEKK